MKVKEAVRCQAGLTKAIYHSLATSKKEQLSLEKPLFPFTNTLQFTQIYKTISVHRFVEVNICRERKKKRFVSNKGSV